MVEKTRYSDVELQEFKDIILGRLEKAKSDYKIFKEDYVGSGNGTNDTEPTFKNPEEGEVIDLSKQEAGRWAERQMKFIKHLQAALVRVENKSYGICAETGKLIPKERLRAVPHATLCIEAKELKKISV